MATKLHTPIEDPKSLIKHFTTIQRKNGKCPHCSFTGKLTKDHIYPKSLGGIDYGMNLEFVCFPCNSDKGNKMPEKEVLQELLKKSYTALSIIEDTIDEYFVKSKSDFLRSKNATNLNFIKKRLEKLKIDIAFTYRKRTYEIIGFINLLKSQIELD